jgi:hypothetical protein
LQQTVVAMRRSTRDRLYRGFDHLLVQKAALEAHLSQSCGELFAIENEVLLYDVTSTYFDQNALRAGEGRRRKGEGFSPHGRGARGRAVRASIFRHPRKEAQSIFVTAANRVMTKHPKPHPRQTRRGFQGDT